MVDVLKNILNNNNNNDNDNDNNSNSNNYNNDSSSCLRSGIGCEASKWPPQCLEMKLVTGAPISSQFPRPEC